MDKDRQTSSGIPIESRIQKGTTLFFELSERDEAYAAAREMASYVYDCFEDVTKDVQGKKMSSFERVGYCVPK